MPSFHRVFFLGVAFLAVAQAATLTYNFDVGWVTANPDGAFDRRTIGINGAWPPPVITGNVNDTIIINVHNSLGNQATSLHFHGLFMNGTVALPVVATLESISSEAAPQPNKQLDDAIMKAPDVDVGPTESINKTTNLKSDHGVPGDTAVQSIYQAHGVQRDEAIAARMKQRKERKDVIRAQAETHKQAGDLLVEQKKIKAALPQYQEATRLWYSNPQYHIALATAFRKLGWYEEAAHSTTVALTLDPKSSEARYLRGVARLEQRLLKPAKIDFEVVLQNDPNHFLARAALAEVNRFLSTSPEDADVANNLALLDFSFPALDYENLEVASVSESDESNHVGNGVPCRFYNQLGCVKGQNCEYSHAPDERSVRDLLGRNVCIWFLLDACKFGISKCVYAHRRDALPKEGWWTDPARIAKVKATVEGVEQKKKDLRQLEQERIRQQYRLIKAQATKDGVQSVKSTQKPTGSVQTQAQRKKSVSKLSLSEAEDPEGLEKKLGIITIDDNGQNTSTSPLTSARSTGHRNHKNQARGNGKAPRSPSVKKSTSTHNPATVNATASTVKDSVPGVIPNDPPSIAIATPTIGTLVADTNTTNNSGAQDDKSAVFNVLNEDT